MVNSKYFPIFALVNLKISTMKIINRVKLDEISKLSFGQHIKSPSNNGIQFLQVKNFSEEGLFLNNVQNFVKVEDIKPNILLEQNDVIFVSKGYKFFAYRYDESIGKAIASSVFYVIRVNQDLVIPDYLVCILNQPKSIAYFMGASAGSSIPSIRKKELLDFEIPVPSLEQQREIAEFYSNHLKQQKILTKLKERKQVLFNEIVYKLTENIN